MATYMRIGAVDGPDKDIRIAGDVSEASHKDWIELASFKFGSGTTGAEDADGSDRIRKNGLTLAKWVGQDSPKLIDWALGGKPYDLQFDCCRENGEHYMRIFVKKARVVAFGQEVADDEMTEELKVLFETIAFEATTFGKDEKRLQPTRAATKAAGATRATRSAPSALVGGGKGAGKRATKTPAQEVAERTAQKLWQGDEEVEFIHEDRVLSIDKINGKEFMLGGFTGSEEISGLFSFRLEVTSAELAIAAKDVIGQPVSFRIADHEDVDPVNMADPREFHGIIAEVHAGQQSSDHRDYTLVVVPWLWFLTKRTDCRIFQKKSVVEIVEAVFDKLGFKDFDKANVRGAYPKLEYCVQYRETDFNFVSRLLEGSGIFYFFRFAKGSHKMILADSAVAHANCDQREVTQSTGSTEESHVRRWVKRLSQVSGKASFRDYNHETPTETLEVAEASVVGLPKIAKYELYDYPGGYPKVSDGKQRAKLRIETEEVAHCVVDGFGSCAAFASGTKFIVSKHECSDEEGQEYMFTGVVHQVYVMPMSDLKPRLYYRNEFECIPKSVTCRPARTTPWPRVHGPQTAVVVGVSGEEIDPDKYGSVKVQFPWDREGKKNENSSCFIRVAQPIAGKKWGGLTLPRIGQEVVVEFLEGSPDRPLITGSVYNKDNMPPYTLPANKTQTGLKTHSSKDGGADNFNELRFEDKKGSEQVYFHAEKDFERVVENDDALSVGTDGKGSQTISIQKDRSLEVVKGDETHTVKEGDRTVTVEQGKDQLDVKKGDRTVTVDMGNHTLTVKQGDQTTKVSLGKVSTEAMQGIELKVGGNSIKIEPAGITIKGMQITLEGEIKTEVKGMICDVNGSAMLNAKGGITMLG